MYVHQALALLTLLGCLTSSLALMGGEVEYLRSNAPKMYCGRLLARTLAVLCSAAEYEQSGSQGKRAGMGTMYNAILSPSYEDQELGWPWMGRLTARTIGSTRGKRGGGVVSECCDKSCKIDELLTYC